MRKKLYRVHVSMYAHSTNCRTITLERQYTYIVFAKNVPMAQKKAYRHAVITHRKDWAFCYDCLDQVMIGFTSDVVEETLKWAKQYGAFSI